MPRACDAIAALWLAVSFHPSERTWRGNDASSSVVVHDLFLRAAVAARTRVTSAVATSAARLPNELRTYDAMAAIQSSGLCPIGTITSVYVVPFTGPVNPCSNALIT